MSRGPKNLRIVPRGSASLYPLAGQQVDGVFLLFFFVEQAHLCSNGPKLCFKRIFQDLGEFVKCFKEKKSIESRCLFGNHQAKKPRTSFGALAHYKTSHLVLIGSKSIHSVTRFTIH